VADAGEGIFVFKFNFGEMFLLMFFFVNIKVGAKISIL